MAMKIYHFTMRQITIDHEDWSVYFEAGIESFGTPHSMHVKLETCGSNAY